jgi:hypothetical protein
MAGTDWRIEGFEFAACNCDFGCPCQFNSMPSEGFCTAGAAFHVTRGHFGATRLDGLTFIGMFKWPGAIHEGNGEVLPIVDERADAAQRAALLAIMSGQESEPGATVFNVFASTVTRAHEPLFRPIVFAMDLAARTARFSVAGLVEATAEPIRNAVTGAPHRVRVVLPDGFEFVEAEFASGSLKTESGPVQLAWRGRHAHLSAIDMTARGPARKHAA